MKVHNNHKYSREQFKDYETRAKVDFKTKDYEHLVDIYTTETNQSEIKKAIEKSKTERVISFHIMSISTKRQDEITAEWIDELLNGA